MQNPRTEDILDFVKRFLTPAEVNHRGDNCGDPLESGPK
jgi:hypothetical protein